MTAWQDGITGASEIIAIIDTGIDTDSPEFAGRIHPDSRDIAGNPTVEAEDDHGTNVAMVAAAARDNTGVVGIAFEADILALRGDRPGTCNTDTDEALDGCSFRDRDIADGVDQAIASGATVINLSLGGSLPTTSLSNAIRRAADAGIVIVVSAGNDGDSTEPGIDPDRPDPFAAGALAAGGANVIIVGSVDDAGEISDFSNRAGDLSASYISARGQRICCIYEDGVLRVTEENGSRFVTVFSGTSFSAPQVAGAVALLAQAFPNLTGTEIVEILLNSAREAGDAGADAVFGRGILDIGAALAPQGTTTLAGSSVALALTEITGVGSSAMGDAFNSVPINTIITDSYDRAYNYNLASGIRSASIQPRLQGAVEMRGRHVSIGSEAVSLAFTVGDPASGAPTGQLQLNQYQAEQARVLAARIVLKIAPKTDLAFAFVEGAQGLVAQLQGQSRPAFLIAQSAGGDTGFFRRNNASFALRKKVGAWGLTLSAETGDAYFGNFRSSASLADGRREERGVNSFAFSADRRFGPVETALGLTWMQEEETVLGAFFHESFGAGGADTMFLDASAAMGVSRDWRIGGSFRQGFTRSNRTGSIVDGSDFISRAWSVDVSRRGVFAGGDSVGFRLSQPLRVENGGLTLNLPVAYDYNTESAILGERRISLTPNGRELLGEMAWRGPWAGGTAAASLFYRQQPGHLANSPDDAGIAVKWNRSF
ncbi:S8 family peptidase [Pontixanthobacter aestiaquae]|uniref:S8 family peptidase n=1 Tax=Pontixanthobacter aestiaquae TaxID=1509367 RepID=UPI0025B58957|nr:S8 family peptidase [Pontixanthobacter aestiaquae]MDN3646335.1 S8 family peptidase [Pontixanthobacter aestiaquae]